jgi:hypothetical protein
VSGTVTRWAPISSCIRFFARSGLKVYPVSSHSHVVSRVTSLYTKAAGAAAYALLYESRWETNHAEVKIDLAPSLFENVESSVLISFEFQPRFLEYFICSLLDIINLTLGEKFQGFEVAFKASEHNALLCACMCAIIPGFVCS